MTETDNLASAETSITGDIPSGTDELRVVLEGNSIDDAVGVRGYSPSGAGVVGDSDMQSGVVGRVGDTSENISYGAVGVAGIGTIAESTGVSGEGPVGVQGFGDIGVLGLGRSGVMGVADGLGPPNLYGTGIYGFSGSMLPPEPPTNVGVYARGDGTATALRVQGKAIFSRSGRTYIVSGHASRTVTLGGVSASSLILATLQTHRTGVYIAAAVPTTGKFTIYLNKAVTATTYFAYLVLN